MSTDAPPPEPAPEFQTRVYDALRALAAQHMASERDDHTLQPTALVHEAWVRLEGSGAARLEERSLFFRAAAESMRRILIEHARKKKRLKRGGSLERMPASIDELVLSEDAEEIYAVDEAIEQIGKEDPQAGEVIRLRFFGGLTFAETAEALGLSERTVHREWSYARARLAELLSGEA